MPANGWFKGLVRRPVFWVLLVSAALVLFVVLEESPNALQVQSVYQLF